MIVHDRRRSPRVEILGRLHGHAVALNVEVAVREIGLGGLSIETHFPFPAGAVHEFDLTLGDGAKVRLRGVVRYSKNVAADGEPPTYISGLEFLDDDADAPASGAGAVVERLQ